MPVIVLFAMSIIIAGGLFVFAEQRWKTGRRLWAVFLGLLGVLCILANIHLAYGQDNCVVWSDGTIQCWNGTRTVTCIRTGNQITCF